MRHPPRAEPLADRAGGIGIVAGDHLDVVREALRILEIEGGRVEGHQRLELRRRIEQRRRVRPLRREHPLARGAVRPQPARHLQRRRGVAEAVGAQRGHRPERPQDDGRRRRPGAPTPGTAAAAPASRRSRSTSARASRASGAPSSKKRRIARLPASRKASEVSPAVSVARLRSRGSESSANATRSGAMKRRPLLAQDVERREARAPCRAASAGPRRCRPWPGTGSRSW